MQTLEEKIKLLTPTDRKTVEGLVDNLVEENNKPNENRKMSFGWEGALSDLKDQYTSVQLQHEILKMWEK